jgi:hypothetical protein
VAESAVRRYAESVEAVNVELAGLARNAKELKDSTLEEEVAAASKTFRIQQEMRYIHAGDSKDKTGIGWSIKDNVGNKDNAGAVGTFGSNRVWSIILRPNGTGDCILTVEPSAVQKRVFRLQAEPRQNAQQRMAASASQRVAPGTSQNARQNARQANRPSTSREREEARSAQIENASKFNIYTSPFTWKIRGRRTLVVEWGGGIPPDPVMGRESAWTLGEIEAEWQFKYGPPVLIGEKETPYTLSSSSHRRKTGRQRR